MVNTSLNGNELDIHVSAKDGRNGVIRQPMPRSWLEMFERGGAIKIGDRWRRIVGHDVSRRKVFVE